MDPDEGQSAGDSAADNQPAEVVQTDQQVTPAEGDSSDDSWKDTTRVPYRRLEETAHGMKELRGSVGSLTEQLTQLQEHITKLAQPNTPQAGAQPGSWDERAKQAANWDEFVGFMKEDFIESVKHSMKEDEERAQKELDTEVKALYDKGLVQTKAEENAVMQFAVKKSEELGHSISLSVAHAWMKETSKPSDEANKVAGKTQSSAKSKGGPVKPGVTHKEIRSKSLDEIVQEAKEQAPQG